MFLLFTASNAGGAILDENDSGTLDRVLASRVSMPSLLFGKLLFLASLAFTQLVVMFVKGEVAFQLDLWHHLAGFVKFGLIAFNTWAIDGFTKVFWRESPLLDLWPQVGVPVGCSVVFFFIGRHLARRWKMV
jgi:ABC-type Na+ efflux pump permease subunit